MIKVGTYLRICDNSGGIIAKCINVSRLSYKSGDPSHIINVVIKKNLFKPHITKKSKIITKGMLVNALIIRTKRGMKRWGNFYARSIFNGIILINNYFIPYGTRLFGLFFRELRVDFRFKKLVTVAKYTI